MASRPLLKECLQLLNISGLNPCKNDAFSKFRAVVVSSLVIFLWLEVCLFCLFKWEGFESMEALTSLFGVYQVLIKFFNVLNQRQNMIKVLNNMENFWPINVYGAEIENEIKNIFKLFKNLAKLVCVFLLIILPVYIAKPFYGSVRSMPAHSYNPVDLHKSPNFELVYLYQIVTIFFTTTTDIALDGLFLSLIVTVICQLKVLKEGIRKIPINIKIRGDSNESLREISKLALQHNLILDCIKGITEIYSLLLLQNLLMSMFCICAGLLGIISAGTPPQLEKLYKNLLYLMFYTGQFFFYCAIGSSLTEESASVSMAVYNTEWYTKTQPELRRACVMIIQRANKPEVLTAGGFFNLNLDSFSKVVRAALSFFTLVKALYKDVN